jgi:hypothetical protein
VNDDRLIADGVRNTERRAVKNARMLVDCAFDFTGRHILSGSLDHVLGPVNEIQVADRAVIAALTRLLPRGLIWGGGNRRKGLLTSSHRAG